MLRIAGFSYSPFKTRRKIFLLLIAFGIITSFYGVFKSSPYTKPNLSGSKDQSGQLVFNPGHISIPKIGVNIDIIPGGVAKGNWLLADDRVMYLPTSGRLGQGFNTILYAHKRKNLFENLKNISIGDLIVVEDKQGRKFSYRVYEKKDIKPEQAEELISDQSNNLTLFTCNGIFDQYRLLVKAKFEKFNGAFSYDELRIARIMLKEK